MISNTSDSAEQARIKTNTDRLRYEVAWEGLEDKGSTWIVATSKQEALLLFRAGWKGQAVMPVHWVVACFPVTTRA